MRNKIYLNDNWKFSKIFDEKMLEKKFDASNMENVRLPHSVVEMSFHYFDENIYQMISAYRRVLVPEESWKGKHVFMTVGAAAHQSTVFVNGKEVYSHNCGYTAYTVDLAKHLFWGQENVIVIRVDSRECLNQPPFGNVIDYMTYGGIYREIYLEIRESSYIKDVFPKVTKIFDDGRIVLVSEVETEQAEGCVLKQELYDAKKNLFVSFEEGKLNHTLKNAKLWDVENPTLYYLRTILKKKDACVLDERWDRIGLRMVEFKSDGFYLNRKKLKLRGLNRHQSYPYVGYAMPESMQRYDAEILKKELGLNAVRTSHYPQSHHFLNACDELGLLVFTEIPGWQYLGDKEWKDQAVQNTRDMILQYRNHPSIFLWGVRINESMDDDELYKRTNDIAHRLDGTRPTSGVRFTQKSSLLEDVYAYNDFSHDGTNEGTKKKSEVTPDNKKGYLISEYGGHMFPTKSYDAEDHRVEHMQRHAKVLDGYYQQEDVAGGFGWCMVDYNTHKDFGSGDRICYHGVLDMFRNPKLAASVYASQKEARDENDVVLEISSAMDIGEHPACIAKDVYAITNADSVKVYKNDKFIREYTKENSPYKHLPHGPILVDDFIGDLMEQGEGFSHAKAEDVKKILLAANKFGLANLPMHIWALAAKCMVFRGMKMSDAVSLYNKYVGNWGGNFTAYRFEAIKDGKAAKVVERQAVTSVQLECKVSHLELRERDTYDVAAIQVKAVDGRGMVLPFYQEPLFMEVTGPIEVIGPSYIALRGGMGGTYIKTTGKNGLASVRIYGENVPEKTIEFQAFAKEK